MTKGGAGLIFRSVESCIDETCISRIIVLYDKDMNSIEVVFFCGEHTYHSPQTSAVSGVIQYFMLPFELFKISEVFLFLAFCCAYFNVPFYSFIVACHNMLKLVSLYYLPPLIFFSFSSLLLVRMPTLNYFVR